MSTNYYAIPKLTEEIKLKIIKAVFEDQLELLRKIIPVKIHLGKSVSGWPFLFNHNNWEYYNSISELADFIDKCEIVDEYGVIAQAKEFKAMIAEKQKIGAQKYTNSQHGNMYIIKDGYVFSTATDFS